jgi:hypothetical protein
MVGDHDDDKKCAIGPMTVDRIIVRLVPFFGRRRRVKDDLDPRDSVTARPAGTKLQVR